MTSPPFRRDVLALDVGGANIKAADGTGWTHAEPFAMWRDAPRLSDVLTRIARDAGPRRIVATMTGEIADCFAGRAEGVSHIVGALAAAAEASGCGSPGIYRVDGRIVSPGDVATDPLGVAASNWHAVARLAASLVPHARALLVDIGSTTCDIVPLAGGRPAPLADDDAGRMATGELVYTGVERTPVPAIVRGLPHRGIRRPVASERFAESRDAWIVLGGLAEDPASTDTADGGPFTHDASRIRLARAMLLEPSAVTAADAERAARWIAEAQARQVARAIDRVAGRCGGRPEAVVYSGHGEALARMALDRLGWSVADVSLPAVVGAAVSRSAPAHALALIARGELS
jgi:(4-(4-[2-(gamma-L-glutamylamino)ethyl]phenoxymethyl)furan-2-yl)methanamine synthase